MSEANATVNYRDIPQFPGYRVGDDGSVWTRKERGGLHQWRLGSEWKRLKPRLMHTGYLRACLRNGDITEHQSIHRLVLVLFVGPCPEGMQCRHLNGIPTDNRLRNLEWSTAKVNHSDKNRHGTMQRGERNGKAKLTADIVRQIRVYRAQGLLQRQIAEKFGVTQVAISSVLKGDVWSHVT